MSSRQGTTRSYLTLSALLVTASGIRYKMNSERSWAIPWNPLLEVFRPLKEADFRTAVDRGIGGEGATDSTPGCIPRHRRVLR